MRGRSALLGAALVFVATAAFAEHDAPGGGGRGAADGGSRDEAARRAKVAVTVGTRTATVGEIEDKIANIPPYQIEAYGVGHDELVHAFVNQVIVRDLLLAEGAAERHLTDQWPAKQRWLRAESTATLRALRADLKSPNAIPEAEVQAYYDANRDRFEQPERINIWRILCKTKDEAAQVIGIAKENLTIARYNDLAREHSLDRATNFRGGNLGFVAPDGQSNEAGVKIEMSVVKAAQAVPDGALVPEPVPEGASWAVVWKRTTVPATKRTLAEATPQIRAQLFREKTETNEKKHIEELRKAKVSSYDPEPLKIIEFPLFDAGFDLPRSGPSSAFPTPPPSAPLQRRPRDGG